MTKQQLTLLEAEAKAYSHEIDKLIGHEKHRRIKTAAYYGYLEAAKKYNADLRAAEERMERMAKALRTIQKWQLPSTGKFWDKEETHPMSYEACYGTNGSRDYMIAVANEALTDYNTYKQQKDGTVNR